MRIKEFKNLENFNEYLKNVSPNNIYKIEIKELKGQFIYIIIER
jgi:hypothetical protein